MSLNESDTRSKLIDPVLHRRGWTEAHIRREETDGAIEVIGGRASRRGKGRVDWSLHIVVARDCSVRRTQISHAT